MALTKGDFSTIQEIVDTSIKNAFRGFWEDVLEPVFNGIHNDISGLKLDTGGLNQDLKAIKEKQIEHNQEFASLHRKLDSEIRYRDDLEVRVKTLEKSR